MNNEQFLKKFTKALSPIASDERDNIINEITSYATDTKGNLFERLGDPQALAQQYLDGETPTLPLSTKALKIGKRIMVMIGLSLAFIALLVGLVFWWLTKDDFNYANINADELRLDNVNWQSATVDSNLNIDIIRSKAVFYWSEDNELRWNCKGESNIGLVGNSITIENQSCLIFLPKQQHTIHTERAAMVLVEPKANVDLTIKQTTLRFADRGQSYYYDIQGSRLSLGDDLKTDQNAEIGIQINALESTISAYR